VSDTFGVPVTGLTSAGFTLTLTRRSGGSMISSAEAVGVTDMGGGQYWIYFTPTAAATLYALTFVPVNPNHIASPQDGYQVDVEAAPTAVSGPYLTTRDNVKTAFDYNTAEHDALIDALLPRVTSFAQTYCGRLFFEQEVTEYPSLASACAATIFVRNYPIATVTSLHFSSDVPRVYDATTLLVDGTDYLIDEHSQRVEFVTPRYVYGASLLRAVRIIYVGGYAIIPDDLARAAEEIIGDKVEKGKGRLYHLTGQNRSDGSLAGIRFDDIPDNARETLDFYRLRVIA